MSHETKAPLLGAGTWLVFGAADRDRGFPKKLLFCLRPRASRMKATHAKGWSCARTASSARLPSSPATHAVAPATTRRSRWRPGSPRGSAPPPDRGVRPVPAPQRPRDPALPEAPPPRWGAWAADESERRTHRPGSQSPRACDPAPAQELGGRRRGSDCGSRCGGGGGRGSRRAAPRRRAGLVAAGAWP